MTHRPTRREVLPPLPRAPALTRSPPPPPPTHTRISRTPPSLPRDVPPPARRGTRGGGRLVARRTTVGTDPAGSSHARPARQALPATPARAGPRIRHCPARAPRPRRHPRQPPPPHTPYPRSRFSHATRARRTHPRTRLRGRGPACCWCAGRASRPRTPRPSTSRPAAAAGVSRRTQRPPAGDGRAAPGPRSSSARCPPPPCTCTCRRPRRGSVAQGASRPLPPAVPGPAVGRQRGGATALAGGDRGGAALAAPSHAGNSNATTRGRGGCRAGRASLFWRPNGAWSSVAPLYCPKHTPTSGPTAAGTAPHVLFRTRACRRAARREIMKRSTQAAAIAAGGHQQPSNAERNLADAN